MCDNKKQERDYVLNGDDGYNDDNVDESLKTLPDVKGQSHAKNSLSSHP